MTTSWTAFGEVLDEATLGADLVRGLTVGSGLVDPCPFYADRRNCSPLSGPLQSRFRQTRPAPSIRQAYGALSPKGCEFPDPCGCRATSLIPSGVEEFRSCIWPE